MSWRPIARLSGGLKLAHQRLSQVTPKHHFLWVLHSSGSPCERASRISRGRLFLRATGVVALSTGLVSIDGIQTLSDNPRVSAMDTSSGAVVGFDVPDCISPMDSDFSISASATEALRRVRSFTSNVARGVEKRSESEEGRTILRLIAVNTAVYTLWKVAPTAFMVRHFASSLEAMRRGRVWTVVSSNFSHMGAFHLAANMFLLDMFGREVASILTPERFYVLYLAGGIASVLVSLATRRMMRNNVLSLGASGSVMATMFMFANLFPDREVYILGIWKLKARDAIVGWALVDAAGLLGSFGKIDFAAHLGGGVFSFGYYNFIREDLSREYQQRKKLMWRRSWGFDNDDD